MSDDGFFEWNSRIGIDTDDLGVYMLHWCLLAGFFPILIVYGLALPLLWLSVKFHRPQQSSSALCPRHQDSLGSQAACNANGFDQFYRSLSEDCERNCLSFWRSCPPVVPHHLDGFSTKEQAANLRAVVFWHYLHLWFGSLPGFRDLLRVKGFQVWSSVLRIPFCDVAVVLDFFDSMALTTRTFVKSAETVECSFNAASVLGAVRLLWFCCALQCFAGQRIGPDRALTAYCLIYPLTDNYLDDPDMSREKKKRFNKQLEAWIRKGTDNADSPEDRTEALVCTMLDAMAEAWPRGPYPQVHYSLNAIHTAQTLSVDQTGGSQCSESFLEQVSAMKGGASLVAAGCLVKGELSPEDLQWLQYLGLGFQLLDDLQDLRSDHEEGRCTLFTLRVQEGGTMDGRIGQLLQYIAHPQALGLCSPDSGDLSDYLKVAIARLTTFLVLEAAAQLQEFLSPECRRVLEEVSPVALNRLKDFRFESRLYDIVCAAKL